MRFRLFVQQHSHGGFSVRVPAVSQVSAYAPAREAAIADVRAQLVEHLKDLGRRGWSKYAFQERQELRPIALEVIPKGKGPQPPIPISVSLLVTDARAERGADYLVVGAPRVEGFHLVVSDAEQLEERRHVRLAAPSAAALGDVEHEVHVRREQRRGERDVGLEVDDDVAMRRDRRADGADRGRGIVLRLVVVGAPRRGGEPLEVVCEPHAKRSVHRFVDVSLSVDLGSVNGGFVAKLRMNVL